MEKLLNIALSDFKLVFRNPALRIFLIMPVLVLGLVLLLLPYLMEIYPIIAEYLPFIMMSALMQCSTMFGFIYAMVLIDEKDTGVAKVYGVLPVAQLRFLLNRLLGPVVYSTLFNTILLYFQPYLKMSLVEMGFIALLSSLIAPILALLTSTLSKNKMEGMTWFKILNLFVNLPIVAFFFPDIRYAFGVFPTFWPFQALYQGTMGENIMYSIGIGLLLCTGCILYLGRRFARTHFF